MTTNGSGLPAFMTVGQAADRLGVAPSTLRTWERRYGLAPGGRSSGGHRRYRPEDVALLQLMRDLVLRGERPAAAARRTLENAHTPAGAADAGPGRGSDDGGHPSEDTTQPDEALPADEGLGDRADRPDERLSVPGATRAVTALAAAAVALDAERCVAVISAGLGLEGVEAAWNHLLRPVLQAAGAYWARTGHGVEVEHLLSEACIEALTAYRRDCPRAEARLPILLACAPGDQHSLPLHVVAAALAERRVPVRVLGPAVPGVALVAAAQRTGARAAFIWAQICDPRNAAALADLGSCRPPLRVVLGGPGWDGVRLGSGQALAGDLGESSHLLAPDPLSAMSGRAGRSRRYASS